MAIIKKYDNEHDGQDDFYRMFLPRVVPELSADDILTDSTDGVLTDGDMATIAFKMTDESAFISRHDAMPEYTESTPAAATAYQSMTHFCSETMFGMMSDRRCAIITM